MNEYLLSGIILLIISIIGIIIISRTEYKKFGDDYYTFSGVVLGMILLGGLLIVTKESIFFRILFGL